jgi:hypothetical protein
VCAPLTVCNETLVFTEYVKYLGIHILSGSHFVIDIDKLKAKLYVALNSLLLKCGGFMHEMVTTHLINKFCTDHYCCTVVTVFLLVLLMSIVWRTLTIAFIGE